MRLQQYNKVCYNEGVPVSKPLTPVNRALSLKQRLGEKGSAPCNTSVGQIQVKPKDAARAGLEHMQADMAAAQGTKLAKHQSFSLPPSRACPVPQCLTLKTLTRCSALSLCVITTSY